MKTEITKDMLKPEEAAARCAVGVRVIYDAIKKGELPVIKITPHRHWRIRESELVKWLKSKEVK